MKTSTDGINAIALHESFRAHLYNDADNNATIGIGHLVHKGPIDGSEPDEFKQGISLERGKQLLAADVAEAEAAVNGAVHVALTQRQFDALVDFTFNCGEGALRGSSALFVLNDGRLDLVPEYLAKWNKSGGKVLAGLIQRRADEGKAFAA